MGWKSAQKRARHKQCRYFLLALNGKKLEKVTSFKYLGATLCKEGICSSEVRIASAMARLSRTWRCNIISFASKFKFYKSLVTSILFYGCETRTILADSGKKLSRLSKPSA